jgi:hypothetical protein
LANHRQIYLLLYGRLNLVNSKRIDTTTGSDGHQMVCELFSLGSRLAVLHLNQSPYGVSFSDADSLAAKIA